MSNRFRLGSAWIKRLEGFGVTIPEVLRVSSISSSRFDGIKLVLSTEELFAVHRAIVEITKDPCIGLRIGGEDIPEPYDPIAIAALCSKDARDSLTRAARYKQLTCPEEIHIHEVDQECWIQFEWRNDDEPDILVDLCYAWLLTTLSKGTGKLITPLRVEYVRPRNHAATYEQHFQCPICFSSPKNILVLNRADLDLPFISHNPELLSMVAPQLEAELVRLRSSDSVVNQAKTIIKRQLAGHKPRIEDVAEELQMSQRTLQRRLLDESRSFKSLVDESRQEMAHHYLRQPALELVQLAFLLGYDDPNSFYRAFQRWEGTSPAVWRNTHLAGHFS